MVMSLPMIARLFSHTEDGPRGLMPFLMLFFPFYLLLYVEALKKYPGEVFLLNWNNQKNAESIIFSVIALWVSFGSVCLIGVSFDIDKPYWAIFFLIQIHFILFARSAIIADNSNKDNTEQPSGVNQNTASQSSSDSP